MRFEKVSIEQWEKDLRKLECQFSDDFIKSTYENIKLPKRATKTSAGYDFFNPFPKLYFPQDSINIIPTGIRWIGNDNSVLLLVPRSGLGFKYGMGLRNTVGVIDSDYQFAANEGHIMASVTANEPFSIDEGKGLLQGIIVRYETCDDEEEILTERTGGFGSTTN